VGSLLGLILAVSNASAQPRPPGTVQPGQIERQFERPPEPTSKAGTITIPEGTQKAPPNADGISFVLNQLTLDGVTVYRPDSLRSIYASDLGKQVTLAEIYRVVDALTARYRNDGYILSQVIVPAQSVENGSIRLQAVEGYISDVRVEGGPDALRARVRRYGEHIRASRPLTAGALERYVLLLNDLPGIQARAVLAPGSTPGSASLVLQVAERRYTAGASADNYGSKAQGRQRVFGDVDMHSLFGGASLTELRGVSTLDHELVYAAAAHDQFLGTHGGKLSATGSYVFSQPQELSIIPLNLTTKSGTGSLTYTYPLARRRSRNIYLRGSFTAFDSTSTIFDVKDTQDRIRAARLGVTYDAGDGLGGVNVVDAEFSQGIAGLGASINGDEYLSRPNGRSDFRRAAMYAARQQSLPSNWSAFIALNAQYAFTDLLAPELFSFGGELFGRGYDPSELLNDHGAALKVDLRYTHTLTGRATALIPYGFVDGGRVWQRTPLAGLDDSQSAASAGAGFRVASGTQFSSFIEFAKPLTRIVGQEGNKGARIFAGVSIQ